ncbi:MAG: selenide, water dikinase SelD, partial [Lachnospiraceae bacterium]|nr:selenide, water dikinase SelD [Lachnospiraceae bacterium]
MGEDVRLTRLAKCAGCGAKVGAGTLVKLLKDLPVKNDPALLVGFDTSDDACVYKIDDHTAVIQTLDFFPPIVDDPRMFGQIAACNALSDIYAMGGEPKLALNIMTVTKNMEEDTIR